MLCRICGSQIGRTEQIQDVERDINTVYNQKMKTSSCPVEFGYCDKCGHGQIEYFYEKDHYAQYNLLNVDSEVKNAGGNAGLREEYYRTVLEKLGGGKCKINYRYWMRAWNDHAICKRLFSGCSWSGALGIRM